MSIAIKVENLSKAYQLGEIGTGTISRDLERWMAKVRGKEDPFLKIGQANDRTSKGTSDVVWSLKDVGFEIKQGEAVGIIGRNGAGKSTLLKILSRVTSPTTGKISGRGRIASLLEVGTGFHPELTGKENIYLNGAILGMRKREIKSKFDEIVEFAGVERYIDTPVKRYSSGMYVRLAFAVAAHLQSEILIVDEVLAVGDAEFQNKCLGKIKDVSEGEGRTVLFVSHNMAAVSRLCTEAVLMDKGSLKQIGKPKEIIEVYTSINGNANEITLADNPYLQYLSINQVQDELEICCHYNSTVNMNIPCLGFVISDSLGNPIFGTNPIYQPPTQPMVPSKKGIIKVRIKQPKLLNGIYGLSVWFGDGKTDFVRLKDVLTFEIINMVLYNKETYAHTSGPVSTIVDWNYDFHL